MVGEKSNARTAAATHTCTYIQPQRTHLGRCGGEGGVEERPQELQVGAGDAAALVGHLLFLYGCMMDICEHIRLQETQPHAHNALRP